MQPIKTLTQVLRTLVGPENSVFASSDLAGAVPDCSQLAVLLSRATKAGLLQRVCRGIYYYPDAGAPPGRLLYHAAARLRAGEFNYLSLESVLSEQGVISQVPFQWIGLMSSGRSHVVDCGEFGRIEFIHTAQRPGDLTDALHYDPQRRLWVASVAQAMRDMRMTRRNLDLVDQEVLHELV